MTARQPAERWASWQDLDSGRLLLLAAAGMLVVAGLAQTAAVKVAAAHDRGGLRLPDRVRRAAQAGAAR